MRSHPANITSMELGHHAMEKKEILRNVFTLAKHHTPNHTKMINVTASLRIQSNATNWISVEKFSKMDQLREPLLFTRI